jgi:hypothetical protein
MERRLDESLSASAGICANLMQEELEEMDGHAVEAATEVTSKMQPHSGVIGILERTEILAASDPGQKPALESAVAQVMAGSPQTSVWKLPDRGKSGARAVAVRFAFRGRPFVVWRWSRWTRWFAASRCCGRRFGWPCRCCWRLLELEATY